jgi:hypothetical protein
MERDPEAIAGWRNQAPILIDNGPPSRSRSGQFDWADNRRMIVFRLVDPRRDRPAWVRPETGASNHQGHWPHFAPGEQGPSGSTTTTYRDTGHIAPQHEHNYLLGEEM